MDKEEFQNLKFEDQVRVFQQSSLAEKTALLPYAHEPEKLTRSLSLEELYLMVHQVGAEERGEIIRFATFSQLMFVADLDCWKNHG